VGDLIKGFRNENIQSSSFSNEVFDLVLALDVAEHVLNPEQMFRDIYRTLKPGGSFISTFPIHKSQVEAAIPAVTQNDDGTLNYIKNPPEYHGNPIDDAGSLVTYDYGYEIHELISEWTDFDVSITRYSNKTIGVIGEYTEVIRCYKS
jgi:SAM-dependent methyltransferase